jgi:micrococcal nuclease
LIIILDNCSKIQNRWTKVAPITLDTYDRTVTSITMQDSRVLEHELLKAGLAWWFQKYALYDRNLAELERKEREAKIGLWSDKDPTPPWSFRKQNKCKKHFLDGHPDK